MIYELRGYDMYDCEYYPIGYYETFEKANEIKGKYQELQKSQSNDDTIEVRGIQETSAYYKENEETIKKLFDADPTIKVEPLKIKTKRAFFSLLDEMTSEEEKKEILEEGVDVHFSIGMWIRNEFIYSGDYEIVHLFCETMTLDDGHVVPLPYHPDMISDTIIKEYRKHLKRIKR